MHDFCYILLRDSVHEVKQEYLMIFKSHRTSRVTWDQSVYVSYSSRLSYTTSQNMDIGVVESSKIINWLCAFDLEIYVALKEANSKRWGTQEKLVKFVNHTEEEKDCSTTQKLII